MNGNARLLGIVTLVVGMAALWPQEAWSYSSGAFDNPTCNTCHNGGTAPTVSFMSNNAAVTTLAVPRGSVVTLALRVKSNSPIQKAAGFNVTSTSPAVVLRVPPVPGIKMIGAEVTHSMRRQNDANGIADFPFTIAASSSATCGSATTLKGLGNSVRGAGTTSGNKAAPATLAVTVTCP
jgi:hypothetical protein